jgi:hypothetical protein
MVLAITAGSWLRKLFSRSHSGIFAILAELTLRELFFPSRSGTLAGRSGLWQRRGSSCWCSIEVWRTRMDVQLLV